MGLTASEVGLLRLVGRNPGISQKAASEQLGVGPSRVVAVLDRLERAGHVERLRSVFDRRSHEVLLTPDGERLLAAL
ncbi:MarR family transcriptional regulator [Gordonia sp. ABSL11-1]|nr:MarR family transcriptional regulator [Gordonia sp. ABSL11-1]MDL9947644.1 MarR family transcriptional regulator [Gordonia sp. ABSL11-1]